MNYNLLKQLNEWNEVLVTQPCLTLCDQMDCSPPGSSSMGFSRQGYWLLLLLLSRFSRVWLFVARQAPLSMGFFRQEYWSGLPFPPPGDLPDSRIRDQTPESPALVGGFFVTEPRASAIKRWSVIHSVFAWKTTMVLKFRFSWTVSKQPSCYSTSRNSIIMSWASQQR